MRPALLAAAALLLAAAPRRDVDVVVSAGTPTEWLGELSRPTPTRDRSVPGTAVERMTVVEQAPRVFSTDVYRFAKITTVDLIGEIPWTVRRDAPTPRGGTPTPGGPGLSRPPPPLSDDVLWLGLSLLLRRTLHPALVGESEAEEYLVHLGEAALPAVTMAKVEGILQPLCASVASKVGPSPAPSPAPPPGKGPIETMLHQLVVEDLTGAYPFAFDGKFARRLALLGDEMYDPVIEATRSKHVFLKRNATLMLGRYPSLSAADRLRELLEDPDPVVQIRALDALARRRDKASVPILLRLLQKKAAWPGRLSLVRALGAIGDPDAADEVLAVLKGASQDYDTTVTALAAASRLTVKPGPEYFRILDQVAQRQFVDPRSNYQPVVPDPPGTRTAVVKELVQLARARAGHAPSASDVLATLRPGPRGNAPLLKIWHAPSIYLLLETLRAIPKGDEALFRIAADRGEDLGVRVRALVEIARLNPPGLAVELRKLATLDEEFSVASVALGALSTYAGAAAVEAARSVVDGYRPGLSPARKALVAEAVKLLAGRNAIDRAAVARIAESEIIAQERARPPAAKPPKRQDFMGRGVPMDFEAPVSFVEEIAVALGRFPDETCRGLLRDFLALPAMAGRGEAAVALGTARHLGDAPALAEALKDSDPWVRFMAYRALKYMSGKDVPCDWIYGTPAGRAHAAIEYASWAKEAAKTQ